MLGNSERSLVAEEKVADVMSKWEKYRNANANASNPNTLNNKPVRKQHHFFLFKKHLFLDQYMDLNDPVEKELLYHQVLHSLRTDRFPITEDEAVRYLIPFTNLEIVTVRNTFFLSITTQEIIFFKMILCHCPAAIRLISYLFALPSFMGKNSYLSI